MIRPTLSVIMSNFNHARFLPDALEAILSQSRPADEIVLIDDGSVDGSMEILESYARSHDRIRLFRNTENRGAAESYERLLELATGDYVVGCAADDYVLPGFFERSMDLLGDHPDAGLCSALCLTVDEQGSSLGVHPLPVSKRPTFLGPRAVVRRLQLRGSWFHGSTVVYRREALIEAGGFRPELRAMTDSFAAHVVALRHGACFVPEPLTVWRRLDASYARTLMSDLSGLREVVDSVMALMRETYGDIFPRRYPSIWENNVLYHAAAEALRMQRDRKGGSPPEGVLTALGADPVWGTALLERILKRAFSWSDTLGLTLLFVRYRSRSEFRQILAAVHRRITSMWRPLVAGSESAFQQ